MIREKNVARMGMRNAYILVGEFRGKRPCRKWVDNINMDFKRKECQGMDLIEIAQVRVRWKALVNTIMTFGFLKTNNFDQLNKYQPISFIWAYLLMY
jgi:hypothetical protein